MPLPLNHPQSLSNTHTHTHNSHRNSDQYVLLAHPFACHTYFAGVLRIICIYHRSSHHEFGPPLLPSLFISASVSLWLLPVFHDLLICKEILSPCLSFLFSFTYEIIYHTHLSSPAHPFLWIQKKYD